MTKTDRRRPWSNALLIVGAAAAFLGLASALSGVGLIILVLVPLPVTAAAVLVRSRWRVAAALCVWGCWFFGLWHVLT
ncbi:MAG: hypothetical protein OXG27_08960 [Chloroflexi bacterium]|nr:hypothetical protein [Chloroflexota bacterium]